jgi:CheY-like chemotaxis protein
MPDRDGGAILNNALLLLPHNTMFAESQAAMDALYAMKGDSMPVVSVDRAKCHVQLSCYADGSWKIDRDGRPAGLWEGEETDLCFRQFASLTRQIFDPVELGRVDESCVSGPDFPAGWSPRVSPEALRARDARRLYESLQTHRRFSEPAPVCGRRVLIVEDHADTARALALSLEMLGHTVRTAQSAVEAVQLGQAEPFDVLVSDIGLGDGADDLDGFALMRHVRDAFGVSGIAMSGRNTPEARRRSREVGFVEYLVKPVDLITLNDAVCRAAVDRPRDGEDGAAL